MPASESRNVCPYDGRCYRKNPQHFVQYKHPQQFPSPSTSLSGTVTQAPVEDAGSLGPLGVKRARSERENTPLDGDGDSSTTSTATHIDTPDESQTPTLDADSPDIQSEPPSEALLKLLMHAAIVPDPSAVGLVLHAAPPSPTVVPADTSLSARLIEAVSLLPSVFCGMLFPAGDVEAVLLAAVQLRPDAPLCAFRGWELTGPIAWALHRATGQSTSLPVFDANEKWRWGRYRWDPPECQTVAMCSAMLDTQTIDHLCYHRDDPISVPGMLVSGHATSHHFSIESTLLSTYLLGASRAGSSMDHYQTQEEAALLAAMEAIRAAHTAAASTLPSPAEAGKMTRASVQREASNRRKKTRVAPTFNGLGIAVSVDQDSEVGYREPAISRPKLKTILESWDVHQKLSPHDSDTIHDQFRLIDIANDEGDVGLALELGQNLFAHASHSPSLVSVSGEVRMNPLLWHGFRLLDCAYALLNRPLYRHVLRCHVPVWAGLVVPHAPLNGGPRESRAG